MAQGFESSFFEKDKILKAMWRLYCHYHQKYVVIAPDYTSTVGHYFKEGVLQLHIDGRYSLCVFAGPKSTKFISFDIDDGGKRVVRKVVDALTEFGFPRDRIYISTSGKKGYHVEMFFDTFIYNTVAKNIYSLVIWRTQLNPHKVEFRPTHTQAIKLPLGIHAKTGNRCWYCDQDTLDPIKDMSYILGIRELPADGIDEICSKWNKLRWNELYIDLMSGGSTTTTNRRGESIKTDVLHKDDTFSLTSAGERHVTMLRIARECRRHGAGEEDIISRLTDWYRKQDEQYISSSEEEVLHDIELIARWASKKVPVAVTPDKSMKITKYDIYHIMKMKTPYARKIAMLIFAYCKMYGAARLSYDNIEDIVGCTCKTTADAVKLLVGKKIINRKSGGMKVKGSQMIKVANEYTLPKRSVFKCPAPEELLADEYVFTEEEVNGSFDLFYYAVLGICADSYLANHLTKPELERVKQSRENDKTGSVVA